MLVTAQIKGKATVASAAKATCLANVGAESYRITTRKLEGTTLVQVIYPFRATDFTSLFATLQASSDDSS